MCPECICVSSAVAPGQMQQMTELHGNTESDTLIVMSEACSGGKGLSVMWPLLPPETASKKFCLGRMTWWLHLHFLFCSLSAGVFVDDDVASCKQHHGAATITCNPSLCADYLLAYSAFTFPACFEQADFRRMCIARSLTFDGNILPFAIYLFDEPDLSIAAFA